jgi:hypothetical protein
LSVSNPPARGARSKRSTDESDCSGEIGEDEVGGYAHDAKAQAAELEIALLICVRTVPSVVGTIDLNREADTGREEIHDEALAEHYLAAKGDAKLTALERGPEARFRRREP